LLVTLIVLIVIIILYYYEKSLRNKKSSALFENCFLSETITVIILSESSDDSAECLFTLLHNSYCPKSFKIVLIESVESYQDESDTIQKYKKMSDLKGHYNLNFIDQIQVHQVKSRCLISDSIFLTASENKYTIVTHGRSQFLSNWDRFLVSQADALDAVNFGGLYLAAFDESRSAYTGVESFSGHAPVLSNRPIWKPGNLRVSWPSFPMLFKTSAFRRLQSCSLYESQMELAMSGLQFWTSKHPIAKVSGNIRPNRDIVMPSEFYEKHKLLGLEKNANALEIISKFGSISSYHWSLSE